MEFRKEIPKNQQIIKTIVAFANSLGGKIYNGIDDDRNITGLKEADAENILGYLQKTIYES
jgi:ATP-dependent DNA helicase RecG